MDITGSIAKRMVESSITVPVYFGGNEIRLNILIDVLYKYFLVRLSLLRSYALLCFCISYFKIQEKKKGVTMGLLKYLNSTHLAVPNTGAAFLFKQTVYGCCLQLMFVVPKRFKNKAYTRFCYPQREKDT